MKLTELLLHHYSPQSMETVILKTVYADVCMSHLVVKVPQKFNSGWPGPCYRACNWYNVL